LTPERLPRSSRIAGAAELRALMTEGKRRRTDHLDLFTRPSPLDHPRLAVIVPRYAHTAPRRNLLRRRLKEICRRSVLPVLAPPLDIVVRARAAAYDGSFNELRAEIVGALCPFSPGSPS
jgi:ribonuclease P protein component